MIYGVYVYIYKYICIHLLIQCIADYRNKEDFRLFIVCTYVCI